MTFLLVLCTGCALFLSGMALGWYWGREDGARDAYDAVDRYLERRERG